MVWRISYKFTMKYRKFKLKKVTKLKVGIIGLGVGEQHIAGYQKHPACQVVSICDFSKEKINLARKKYPHFQISNNADCLLEDPNIDIVSIASYDNYHYAQIKKAIDNNKHIFVEKPLCLYEKEALNIRALLKKRPTVRLSSNLILRRSPRFRYLKKLIKNGKLGSLYYVEGDYNYGRINKIIDGWRGKIDFYSVVYGGGVHIIDLLHWLTDDDVIEVISYGNNIASGNSGFRYNDMVVSILKFKSGIVGKIAVNFGCVFPHFHNLSIYGTKATFINGLKEGLLFESRNPVTTPKVIKAAYPGVHKGDLIYSFVDSILYGTQPEITEEEVFRAMSVCFAIEKSLSLGNSVRVKYI